METTVPVEFETNATVDPRGVAGIDVESFARGVASTVIIVLGSIGNVLSVLVLWRESHTKSSSLVLLCLAIADTCVLAVQFVMVCPRAFCEVRGTCVAFRASTIKRLGVVLWPLNFIAHLIATWLTVLVTFQRYLGVCHPHAYTTWTTIRKTRVQITVTVLFCVVYGIPRFLEESVTQRGNLVVVTRTTIGNSKIYQLLHSTVMYFAFIYILPFGLLAFMAFCLVRGLRAARTKVHGNTTSSKSKEVDLTVSLVVLVCVYFICQVLNPVRRAIHMMRPPDPPAHKQPLYVMASIGVITYAAVNFVVFSVFSRKFRKDLRKLLGLSK
jgi:hypothetical protein